MDENEISKKERTASKVLGKNSQFLKIKMIMMAIVVSSELQWMPSCCGHDMESNWI